MMKDMLSTGLTYISGQLKVIDQTLLPREEKWLLVNNPDEMCEIIKKLQVRGAPLIGIAAALSLANYAIAGASPSEIKEAAEKLNASRPTAVNLMMAMDRMFFKAGDVSVESLKRTAESIFAEDVELCEKMANHGAELVNDGDNIITHCNTGGLATAGLGTALGVIIKAHQQGKKIHVYVDETRPLLQGGRLNTWELAKAGVPYTLICDSMAAFLMKTKKISKIFVGSDRIAANGDFANKIGTYSLAVNAKHHGVDFYPVAPYTTVDMQCQTGDDIPIEERKASEVQGVAGYFNGDFQSINWAASEAKTWNPAFDVTPSELVTGLVLDTGVYTQEQLKNGILQELL